MTQFDTPFQVGQKYLCKGRGRVRHIEILAIKSAEEMGGTENQIIGLVSPFDLEHKTPKVTYWNLNGFLDNDGKHRMGDIENTLYVEELHGTQNAEALALDDLYREAKQAHENNNDELLLKIGILGIKMEEAFNKKVDANFLERYPDGIAEFTPSE